MLDRAERVIALLSDSSLTEPHAGAGPSDDARPALPRRNRQTHLSPKLRHPVTEPASSSEAADPGDAELARSRMSALQRGTIRARATDPEQSR
jgi:hypothetical protein